MSVTRASVIGAAVFASIACGTIERVPRTTSPLNESAEFPCDRYTDTPVKASAREGRCEVPGIRPSYDFFIVVDVPDTSPYAAGHTFVVAASELSRAPTNDRCAPPKCLALPALGSVSAAYRVRSSVSQTVGASLPDLASIPVRASYVPLGRGPMATFNPALPLDVLFASSRVIELDGREVFAIRTVPVGSWTRVLEPLGPFAELFPPRIDVIELRRGGPLLDVVELGGASGGLDDPTGTSRDATVRRAEGLDGWRVWLEDHATGRRISVVRTLEGVEAHPRLFTTGRGTSLEGVDAVVAPPSGYLGVPRLATPLIAGAGLSRLDVPALRAPVALEGLVATRAPEGSLQAVTGRVSFRSASITLPNGDAQPLLHYATEVATDDRGRFATLVPPGVYDVTVEPGADTGFSSMRDRITIAGSEPLTLLPSRRADVQGSATLTDGRPLSGAEVVAEPEPEEGTADEAAPVRTMRTRTDESGAFRLALDRGKYVITVIPEAGTGFPRVLRRTTISAAEADLGTIRVPPPTRLTLQLRDQSTFPVAIPGARVRIYALVEGRTEADPGHAFEIGSSMADARGDVELLLGPQPR